ncbi:MAG: ATP-dependent DNA helicase, partial [candidate division WOR-3 bacterium]
IRDRSIDNMDFPYVDYRPGQEQMINASTAAIEDRIPLLIQAPTGIGKTMAVIHPALRGFTQGQADRIFYLTARTTGRNTAEQSLETLRADGLRCKYLSITAKEKVCFCPSKSCDGEECEYARGFYDRINEAVADAYSGEVFTRGNLAAIARKHRVCPFEFSLELSLWVDVIICDYNYLFDPRVYLRRFFETEKNNYVVLVDEAHNLVDRSREMYSAAIRRLPFSSIRRSVRKKLPALYRTLGKVNTWMIKTGKTIPEGESVTALEECPLDLCRLLRKFTAAAEHWLSRNEEAKFRDDLLDLYFDVRRFLNAADRYGTNYATYYCTAGSDLAIKIFCIDPSEHLREKVQKCRSTIFFSATLTPVEYFIKLFGCEDNARVISLPSPFPSDNICVLVAGKISAMYKYREFTKDEVARMIAAMIDRQKGNYLVFFPSYDYMKMVHAMFQRRRPQVELIMQEPGMSEEQRDEFLMNFNARPDGYLTGFAVMGGFFAESIDLVGERLTGAAVVGVGFPQISVERELIRAYFDGQNGQGFAFAYQVPGMIKVLQAAGRVIRSEDDKGVVLFIDTRYTRPPYSLMFPEGWQPLFVSSVEKAGILLQDFWKSESHEEW